MFTCSEITKSGHDCCFGRQKRWEHKQRPVMKGPYQQHAMRRWDYSLLVSVSKQTLGLYRLRVGRTEKARLLSATPGAQAEREQIVDSQCFGEIKKRWLAVKETLVFHPSSGCPRAIYLCNHAEPLIPCVKMGLMTLTLQDGCEDSKRHKTEVFGKIVRKAGYGFPGERISVVVCSLSLCPPLLPEKFRRPLVRTTGQRDLASNSGCIR